jgi:hypothetical protein
MSERTRTQEIAYRCAIYDATNAATAVLEERGTPDSALIDLCGWVLFIVSDLAAKDGKPLSEQAICERVVRSMREAAAFYDTID